MAASFALAALLAGPALATTGYRYADQFGGAGNDDGQFADGPYGVAVVEASGDVLASDPGHTVGEGEPAPRIERFNSTGVFQSAISIDGSAYRSPAALAVDPAGAGAVYVSAYKTSGAARILKYSLAGAFAYELDASTSGTIVNGGPVAVDPSNGNVYVTATDRSTGAQVVDAFDPSTGAFVSSFDGASGSPDGGIICPGGLAVDNSHDVYVMDQCYGRVDRFSAAGEFEATVDDGSRGWAQAIAVDPVSDHLLVARFGPAGPEISDRSAALEQLIPASAVGSPVGLAVGHDSGMLYVADIASAKIARFTEFDGPTVTTEAASDVESDSVTLNGTIDPGGAAATYRFDWGLGTNYGSKTDESDAGDGTGASPVSAGLTGLVPNTTYHYRLVGSNAGGRIVSADRSVTTAPVPPDVDGSPAHVSNIEATSATVHGTVDPHNSQTAYRVEYGTTTAYGSTSPDGDAGSGIGDVEVVSTLEGLEPNTTYHYRIVADNGTGGPQNGADGTFSTSPGTPASGEALSTRRATLSGTINPHGEQTTYHFEYGPTAGYGEATEATDGGAGDGVEVVERDVDDLEPGTTYHVRVVAKTGEVERYGPDGTFTTQPAPIGVTTFPTGVSTDGATLTGTVDTHGHAGIYRFEVSSLDSAYETTTDDRSLSAGSGPRPVSESVSGLPAGETFTVRLVVTSNETTAFGDWTQFATAPEQPVVPQPPSVPELVNGGKVSNAIVFAIRSAPSNAIEIRKVTVAGKAVTVRMKVPGPGKLTASGSRTKAATRVVEKAGIARLTIRLDRAGAKALAGSKNGRLTAAIRIRFTPTGGTPRTKRRTVTFKAGDKR